MRSHDQQEMQGHDEPVNPVTALRPSSKAIMRPAGLLVNGSNSGGVWPKSERPENARSRRSSGGFLLLKSECLNMNEVRRLVQEVHDKPSNRKINFSRPAYEALVRWCEDPTKPLPSQAYARVSNWFLTDSKVDNPSPRSKAAERLWNALFCARPRNRLTDPHDNGTVLETPFSAWWDRQQKCQCGDC